MVKEDSRKIVSNRCDGCKYLKTFPNSVKYCDYLCMTGQRRGSTVAECDKYKEKE